MRFVRLFLVGFVGFLASCTSPYLSQELSAGKVAFQSGDYANAYQKLLPVARSGRPEAQYAVGYMNYYGYGVPQNITSGLAWMDRAAAQNYAPAFTALDIIHRRESVKALNENDEDNNANATDEFGVQQRASLTASPPGTAVKNIDNKIKAKPKSKAKIKVKPKIKPKIQTQPKPAEVNLLPAPAPDHVQAKLETKIASHARYVLQLYGSYDFDTARDVQKGLNLSENSQIWRTKNKGRDWYIVSAGQFDTVASANVLKQNLTAKSKSIQAWVRPADGLEAV